MEWIGKIKKTVGHFILERENAGKKREIKVCNLQFANSVGIIYMANDEKAFNVVKNFVRLLKQDGIKSVQTLGYANTKQMPQFLTPERDFDYFTRNEISWYKMPVSPSVSRFTSTDFDVLIDLSMREYLPLAFILSRSRSGFKVGKGSPVKNKYLDLVISLNEDQGINILVRNVSTYLNMINKESTEPIF